MRTLAKIVAVDEDKCVNCHACIAKCPVKFCNDASGDHVSIHDDLCIGCGECIKACTHEARIPVDDFDNFMSALKRGEKIVAVVAPAVASNFPGRYLNLNGWLRSLGVAACFDVSFGAELTVRTYLEHVKDNKPACVIAQPCPAIVSYIETYRPELIPYLAPADSPMLHTVKMIREYYPQFARHKTVVISPCVAKKREFEETGLGDFNVTIDSLKKYMKRAGIDLGSFAQVEYDNPPAERAVLFSTPGGLQRTAERWSGDLRKVIRKIEGPELIYPYLDRLKEMIDAGEAPLLIDCLNCEAGCNGGTGTGAQHEALDRLEQPVEKRQEELRNKYRAKGPLSTWRTKRKLERLIDDFWKPGLYGRTYENRAAANTVRKPSQRELRELYNSMSKTSDEHIYNCTSCGYNSCEGMATAIHNGLNQPINCHHHVADCLKQVAEQYFHNSSELSSSMEEASSAMTEVQSQTRANAENAESSANLAEQLRALVRAGQERMAALNQAMGSIRESGQKITGIVKLIDDIAFQTNLLALNAAVEAARAGSHGKGFAVVAQEVRNLSNRSAEAARNTTALVEQSAGVSRDGEKIAQDVAASLEDILKNAEQASRLTEQISIASREQALGTQQIDTSLRQIDTGLQNSTVEAEKVLNQIVRS